MSFVWVKLYMHTIHVWVFSVFVSASAFL